MRFWSKSESEALAEILHTGIAHAILVLRVVQAADGGSYDRHEQHVFMADDFYIAGFYIKHDFENGFGERPEGCHARP